MANVKCNPCKPQTKKACASCSFQREHKSTATSEMQHYEETSYMGRAWVPKDLGVTGKIFEDFGNELKKADEKYPPMSERIEGFFTLLCEVCELGREVFRANYDPVAMEKECNQVGAMAAKFKRDCVIPRHT